MAKMKRCPTCKRPLPPVVSVSGRRRQALLEYVLRYPEGVTRSQILDAIYADDPDGGPENQNIVAVMVKHINDILEKQKKKVRIRGSGGPGSIYRAVYL